MAADAPPILRFTLRVLECRDVRALAQVCVDDLVGLFGAKHAIVTRGDEPMAEAGTRVSGAAELSFALAAPSERRARLAISVGRDEDLPIVRNQLLDLVAVVRSAWANALLLARESRRAHEDVLTGLDNRRGVQDHLDNQVQHALHTGIPLTVMIVDLDHFKRVNDRHGHSAGDDVLKLAASCFRAHLREADRICRWGGDEFLVVLDGMDAPSAVSIAERLRNAFAEETRARGATMTIGIADVASVETAAVTAGDLLQRADTCLYAAKDAGRNCTCVAPPARFVA